MEPQRKITAVSISRDTRAQIGRVSVTIANLAKSERPISASGFVTLLVRYAEAHPDRISAFLEDPDTER